MERLEKDFKNIVVLNFGYVYGEAINTDVDEEWMKAENYISKKKWFDYVVGDDVVDSIRGILHSQPIDKTGLKKVIYDDVLNTRNIVYASLDENTAVNAAKKLSDNVLVLQIM